MNTILLVITVLLTLITLGMAISTILETRRRYHNDETRRRYYDDYIKRKRSK